MSAYKYDFIQTEVNLQHVVSKKLALNEPFCLTRIPDGKVELFAAASDNHDINQRQVICKSWRTKSRPIYFYAGLNEKSQIVEGDLHENETSFEDYKKSFNACMENLQTGKLKKIVLSRIKQVAKPGDLDLYYLFLTATSKYPNAFVYLISHPKEGIWFGASPEILLHKTTDYFESVSLAGTQPLHYGDYTWGEKEKIEQALVSDQIRTVLNESNSKILSETGPFTVEAGSVAHLKTRFLYSSEESIQHLLDKLHPTPAVSGLPTDLSINIIEKTELHERGLYTGYIGVIDQESADIYVNLRCMKIGPDVLNLYLGGGITKDSDMKKEWEETELKAKTLVNLLNE